MPRRRPEQELQIAAAQMLQAVLPPSVLWWHTPNGGGRSRAEAGLFRAMGVRAGVPDLVFVLPDGKAAFIELKVQRHTPSPAQDAFMEKALAVGCRVQVCRSLEEVFYTLEGWGLPMRGRLS